jgi:hypothetical protein
MMWLKGRHESRSTLGREWVICKRCLGKSSEDSNNGERLLIINLREAVSFRARIWLVVATILQGQHPSFRALFRKIHFDERCTGVFLQTPRRRRAFHLATFVLRSTWANWHNSRQCCNLDELVNQSKLTHNLASAQGTRGHEKTF